jgi:hypothetical protein
LRLPSAHKADTVSVKSGRVSKPSPIATANEMAGKRDEAEGLFAQGFKADSAEVLSLGLKKDTLRRYFRDWEKKQPPAPTEGTDAGVGFTVEITPAAAKTVGDLKPRQLFEYGGQEYRVNQILPGRIHVLLVEDAPTGGYKIERLGRYLPADTVVVPK